MRKTKCIKYPKDRCIYFESGKYEECGQCRFNYVNTWNAKAKDNFKQVKWFYLKCDECDSITYYTYKEINYAFCRKCHRKIHYDKIEI